MFPLNKAGLISENIFKLVLKKVYAIASFPILVVVFELEFVSIGPVINHMTYYNFQCSPWWKIHFKNPLQDFLSSLNAVISTNESTRIITNDVIYNLAYTYKFQSKSTHISF